MAILSRNKGIFSLDFLVPNVGLLVSILIVEAYFSLVVRPHVAELEITQRLSAAQQSDDEAKVAPRSIYIIIKDPEQEVELMLWLWATIILTYKLVEVGRERGLLRHDFIGVRQGERIIPEDALDRYKELKTSVEATPRWRERLLPDFLLAALHRFQATNSVQDAASAVKERAELVADNLDSELSLIRYIAWAIPAVGFIGTVRGIGDALSHADEAIKGDLSGVVSALGLAFNSTLVALILSMILMYMLHMLQSRQEALILELQNYCREKLVHIMRVPQREAQRRED
ncbi:MotA/TolQ/ExbB proton channel family protein [Lacunisphaera limnophila]|uniref:MotA/TolQ/ExbB proton channel family protein n=1 Tax=Lacunisphaera limnophila TaxID=1838286 RepID=A0A1D8AS19_9BACT|nr:MotA/TolQ/ExbB proton channel family protein [Lacunisphaera limnophila]AOS43676.1 MotA/TolQ/ExbB proton channel family protein [Lacunisphaera limnophila]